MEGHVILDITNVEKFAMLLLALFTILFGILPWIALDMMSDWTNQMFDSVILPILGGFEGGA